MSDTINHHIACRGWYLYTVCDDGRVVTKALDRLVGNVDSSNFTAYPGNTGYDTAVYGKLLPHLSKTDNYQPKVLWEYIDGRALIGGWDLSLVDMSRMMLNAKLVDESDSTWLLNCVGVDGNHETYIPTGVVMSMRVEPNKVTVSDYFGVVGYYSARNISLEK